jgi:hypothetical protein
VRRAGQTIMPMISSEPIERASFIKADAEQQKGRRTPAFFLHCRRAVLERMRDEADASDRKSGQHEHDNGEADPISIRDELGHVYIPIDHTKRFNVSQFVNFAICLCP